MGSPILCRLLEREVDDGGSEGSGRAIMVHKSVQFVNTLHLPHESERRPGDNVGVRFHVVYDGLVELPDLALTALLTVVLVRRVEVLHGKS